MSNETEPRHEENMIQEELETLRTPTSRTVYLGKGRYRIEVEACAEERSGSTSNSTVKCFCSQSPNTTYTETGNFAVGSGIGGRGTQKALLVFSGLPTLSPSCYITSASLTVKPAVNGSGTMAMNAYEVTSSANISSPTWNNPPVVSMPFDYRIPSQYYGDPCTYDITNQVRRWYDGKNWGIVLEGQGGENRTFFGVQHTSKPVVTIDYISFAGLESWFAMDTHGIGRSGSAAVNLFNGNLVLSHQETVMNGSRMPVSVSRYYNSCESGSNDLGVGYGWRYSVQQSIVKNSASEYAYTDADGTVHYFTQTGGVWKDGSGLNLVLSFSGSNALITDEGNTVLTFPAPAGTGETNRKMLTSVADSCGNTATVTWNNKVPTKVTDGANRETILTAAQAQYPGNNGTISYTYSGGNLTKITYEDSKTTSFTYDSNHYLTKIKDWDNKGINIEYQTTGTNPVIPRVTRVTYFDTTGALYGGRAYEYGDCRTTVTELLGSGLTAGKKLTYHFNDKGNLLSVNDELGYAYFAGYQDSLPENHPDYVSKLQRVVPNYLKNHHFLDSTSTAWTFDALTGSGSGAYATDQILYGGRSYKLTQTSSSGRIGVKQTVTMEKGRSYTFSAYYKTSGSVKGQVMAQWKNSSGTTQSAESLSEASTDAWRRLSVSFTVPSNASTASVTVFIMSTGGTGNVWCDGAQLEEGEVPNRYNMLHNGAFMMNSSGTPTYFSVVQGATSSDGVQAADSTRPSILRGKVLHITGNTETDKIYQQSFSCFGNADDAFVAGGWARSFTRPRSGGAVYRMDVIAKPTSGNTFINIGSVLWSEEWTGWHYASVPVRVPWEYKEIGIQIHYGLNINYAEFSNLFLYKEEFGKKYTYNTSGDVIAVKNTASLTGNTEYDAFHNQTSVQNPGRPNTVKTVMTWGSNDTEKKKHLLRTSTNPVNITQEYTYDSAGNQLTGKTRNSANSLYIRTENTYTSNKNYPLKSKDARAQESTLSYDLTKGTLTSAADPANTTVNYSYDARKRQTGSSCTVGSNTCLTARTYNGDDLTQISHNNLSDTQTAIDFTYDTHKRLTETKIGTYKLTTNEYNQDGTLARVKFGTDSTQKTEYGYDAFHRLTTVKYDGASTARYTYAYGANGQIRKVTDTNQNRTWLTEYDLAERPMRIIGREGNNHLYTAEVTYDGYSHPSGMKEQVGTARTKYNTTIAYDTADRVTSMTFTNGSVSYTYDGIGRIATRTVTAGSYSDTCTYSYLAGGYGTGSTTGLITSQSQGNESCTYTFDTLSRITSYKRSSDSLATTYEYDAIGQLTRVNNPTDPRGGSNGATWMYIYDMGGNLRIKERFAYATGSQADIQELITCPNGDSNWRDLLTKYHGNPITWNEWGNVLTDDQGRNYTWGAGRELRSMTVSSGMLSFTYDHNGLRTGKTLGTAVTKYIYHGDKLVHVTIGSTPLHIYYDAQGRPAILNYNGTVYIYITNMQGDVLGLRNTSGTEVVRYNYDPWGYLLGTTGSLATTVGKNQPLRYRGYVYDEETGLYYLQSRYYNPEWGRFISTDDVQNDNAYSYCSNSPLGRIDSNGCYDEVILGQITPNNSGEKWISVISDSAFDLTGVLWPSNPRENGYAKSLHTTDVTYAFSFSLSGEEAKSVTEKYQNSKHAMGGLQRVSFDGVNGALSYFYVYYSENDHNARDLLKCDNYRTDYTIVLKLYSEDNQNQDFAAMIRIKYDTYNDFSFNDVLTSYSDWFILGRFSKSETWNPLTDASGFKRPLCELFNP